MADYSLMFETSIPLSASYYRARYYDPTVGRFISEDPSVFEGGMNFYPYVDSNAVNWFDPKVQTVKVIEGNPLLDGAATAAVKRWKYRSLTVNGKLVHSIVVVLTFDKNGKVR